MELTSYQREFLERLISIRSTGADPEEGAPYGKGPREALAFFLDEAAKAGFRTGVSGDRAGWVEYGEGDRLIGIVCHLDVVPAGDGWNTDPFTLTFSEDDSLMTARGIIDDKGPAAASFFAMKELLDEGKAPTDFRLRLILGTDEERSCSCIEYYAEHEEVPDFSITPDSEFPAIYCEKGILHVTLNGKGVPGFTAKGGNAVNMVPASASCTINGEEMVVTGKSAHASVPETGINAISLLLEAIESFGHDIDEYPVLRFIKDFDAARFTGCTIEDESGNLTSNIGVIKADSDECTLMLDFRVPYTYKVKDAVDNLTSKAREYGFTLTVQHAMDALYIDKNDPSIRNLTAIWKRHMDKFTDFKEEYRSLHEDPVAVGGGTYARHMANMIAFGVELPWKPCQFHQANESVPVQDFIEWIKIIREFIETV